MTTSRGMYNAVSEIVGTQKKEGTSSSIGDFPEGMMHSVFPRFFAPFLYGDIDLGQILNKCYDERMLT